MDARVRTFAEEASRRLGFLVDEMGFTGPVTQTQSRPELTPSSTTLIGQNSAHKGHAMRRALDQQSHALRRYLESHPVNPATD
jgi:hypothetical protein